MWKVAIYLVYNCGDKMLEKLHSLYQICPGLNANEIQIPYDKHQKVSLSIKSHQKTQNSVKYEVMWKCQITLSNMKYWLNNTCVQSWTLSAPYASPKQETCTLGPRAKNLGNLSLCRWPKLNSGHRRLLISRSLIPIASAKRYVTGPWSPTFAPICTFYSSLSSTISWISFFDLVLLRIL